jgi:hypothetical protein
MPSGSHSEDPDGTEMKKFTYEQFLSSKEHLNYYTCFF